MTNESNAVNLSDQELSEKAEVVLKYSCRSLPNGLHLADRELLEELKKRFDVLTAPGFLDNDDELLAALDEVIVYTQTSDEIQVLGKVRDRLFGLTAVAESIKEDLAGRLSSIISYPAGLTGSDIKTLEDLLAYLTSPS